MDRDETRALLMTRRDLTGEQFNDGTIDAWHEALRGWDRADCRMALNEAALAHEHVNVRHMVEQLPKRSNVVPIRPEPEPSYCELCGGDGWLTIEGADAHNARTCKWRADDPTSPECFCSAVMPCRCSAGQRHEDAFKRTVEHNAREMRRLGLD